MAAHRPTSQSFLSADHGGKDSERFRLRHFKHRFVGEGVVKIGLTRRLEPSDHISELGDASMPFLFDTYAMIYFEEAPALEVALHTEFAEQRNNAENMRKEFFRVSLTEAEESVQRLAPDADFHADIEAQEFYETLAKRKELAERLVENDAGELPMGI